jgi:2,3-bisphosphoglycerate-independent phosphoglycerate mutase
VVKRILVVLDGAPEPVQPWPTSFEAAATPALDAMCAEGEVGRLHTTPDGLAPGSETGLPVLLGAEQREPAGRGWIEAAAADVPVAPGLGAWRLDLLRPDGRRASEHEARRLVPLLSARLAQHRIIALRGHRLLAVGAERPRVKRCSGFNVVVWPDGKRLPPSDALRRTTLVCGPGAAAGIGRLLGARVVVPDGATGDTDSLLGAKTAAALRARGDSDEVVVHVGAPDEAAHRGEREAKRRAIEAADQRVVAPLHAAVRRTGGLIAVTADHGTCPWTGRHDAEPVPYVLAGSAVAARGPRRLTERAVAAEPIAATPWGGRSAGLAATGSRDAAVMRAVAAAPGGEAAA